jgi:hypothetical protein
VFADPEAVTATAHKLARIFYTVARCGAEYRRRGEEFVTAHRTRVEENRHRRAKELGYELRKIEVPTSGPASEPAAG